MGAGYQSPEYDTYTLVGTDEYAQKLAFPLSEDLFYEGAAASWSKSPTKVHVVYLPVSSTLMGVEFPDTNSCAQCAAIIVDEGIVKVTHRHVAERAGMPLGSITAHCKSIDDLTVGHPS